MSAWKDWLRGKRKPDETAAWHTDIEKRGPVPQRVVGARGMIDHVIPAQFDRIEFRTLSAVFL